MAAKRIGMRPTTTQIVHMRQGSGPVRKFMAPVKLYTRFVIFSRSFLWVLVAGTIAVVVWVVSDNTGQDGSRMVFSNMTPGQVVQSALDNAMLAPRYQGMDSNNQPFTVVADKATQKDEQTVLLDVIRADLTQKDGKWIGLNAGSGEMNTESKQLELTNGVSMFYEGGFEFRTDHAHIDIEKGTAYGDAPVEGQGPTATLKADSFSIADSGRLIRFNGSVRMKLYH